MNFRTLVVACVIALPWVAGDRTSVRTATTADEGATAERAVRGNPHFPKELAESGIMGCTHGGGISKHLIAGLDWVRGGAGITARWTERDAVGKPHTWSVRESTAYTVTGVGDCEGGRVLFVAGLELDGTRVLERWRFATRRNGYFITSGDPSVEPIGRPMRDFQAVEKLDGATWSPPDPRDAVVAPAVRERLWTGNHVGVLCAVVADPSQRYVMLLSYPDGVVYRVDLSRARLALEHVQDAACHPYLAGANTMNLWRHAADGRTVVISKAHGCIADGQCLMLGDANNDGIFESSAMDDGTRRYAEDELGQCVWSDYMNTGESTVRPTK